MLGSAVISIELGLVEFRFRVWGCFIARGVLGF